MPLVPALCPQCGAALEVNSDSEAAVCKFCNTPFITEKAITNYNISYNTTNNTTNVSNSTTVNNISNSEVHIHQNGEDAQTLLDNIKGLCARERRDLANKCFDEMQKKYPSDYRTDEAAVVCAIAYGISHISLSSSENFLYDIIKSMQMLSKSNFEKAKEYSDKIQQETNEFINARYGVNLSGGLYFYKIGIGTLPSLFERLTNYVDEYYTKYMGGYTNPYSLNEFQLGLVYDFIKGVNPYVMKILPLIDFLETGKLAFYEKISPDYKLHGYDDAFCEYIIKFAETQSRKLQSRLDNANYFIGTNDKNANLIRTDIFSRLINAAENLMSADGAKRRKAEAERIKEVKRQAEQREYDKQVVQMRSKYDALLADGKTKEALAYLQQNDFIKNKSEELKKFKKTLFGYKYLG